MDSGLPNRIDSLLIDLDNLQLGADFTEEMTFTGFHNISHMTMSFRVECSLGFCGPDCKTTPLNNLRVATCQADGTLTCTDNRLDPSPLVACNDCLYNLDITTGCSTCVQINYDPITNCTACLPGYNIDQSCSTCISTNFNRDTNCFTCVNNRDLGSSCSTCLPGYDSNRNCTVCLSGQNISTRCTTCLSGLTGSNCEPGECYTIV